MSGTSLVLFSSGYYFYWLSSCFAVFLIKKNQKIKTDEPLFEKPHFALSTIFSRMKGTAVLNDATTLSKIV